MSLSSITNRNQVFHSLEGLPASQRRIVDFLTLRHDGATRHEIAAALRMPLSSVCGRVSELENMELVQSTDEKRETQYGKTATVVRIVQRTAPIQLELMLDA